MWLIKGGHRIVEFDSILEMSCHCPHKLLLFPNFLFLYYSSYYAIQIETCFQDFFLSSLTIKASEHSGDHCQILFRSRNKQFFKNESEKKNLGKFSSSSFNFSYFAVHCIPRIRRYVHGCTSKSRRVRSRRNNH